MFLFGGILLLGWSYLGLEFNSNDFSDSTSLIDNPSFSRNAGIVLILFAALIRYRRRIEAVIIHNYHKIIRARSKKQVKS